MLFNPPAGFTARFSWRFSPQIGIRGSLVSRPLFGLLEQQAQLARPEVVFSATEFTADLYPAALGDQALNLLPPQGGDRARCPLPIAAAAECQLPGWKHPQLLLMIEPQQNVRVGKLQQRSEERRVGKERRCRRPLEQG